MDDIQIEQENDGAEEKIKKIKEKLQKCQKEKEEYLAGWQRTKADFINARKEETKRQDEFLKSCNQQIILEILPVLDSFNLALREEPQNKGLLLIKSQLLNSLEKYGLSIIKSVGEKFNPEFHEAVEETESDKESDIIIEEVQKGYMLHGKILRAAKVKISK